MQLMMYIGNDLIESVELNPGFIRKPGYIGGFKRCLKLKYEELIRISSEKPEFLVIEPAPVKISAARRASA